MYFAIRVSDTEVAKTFIKLLLNPDPPKRPTVEEALGHDVCLYPCL